MRRSIESTMMRTTLSKVRASLMFVTLAKVQKREFHMSRSTFLSHCIIDSAVSRSTLFSTLSRVSSDQMAFSFLAFPSAFPSAFPPAADEAPPPPPPPPPDGGCAPAEVVVTAAAAAEGV